MICIPVNLCRVYGIPLGDGRHAQLNANNSPKRMVPIPPVWNLDVYQPFARALHYVRAMQNSHALF